MIDEKIKSIGVDFEKQMATVHFEGAEKCVITLGANISQVGFETHKKVEHDYVISSAKIAKQAGVKHLSVLSSVGADKESWFGALQLKGSMEQALVDQGFESLSIFRPSMIMTEREGASIWEKMGVWFFSYFDWMVPDNYKGTRIEVLAKAMMTATEQGKPGVSFYYVPDIKELGKDKKM